MNRNCDSCFSNMKYILHEMSNLRNDVDIMMNSNYNTDTSMISHCYKRKAVSRISSMMNSVSYPRVYMREKQFLESLNDILIGYEFAFFKLRLIRYSNERYIS